VVVDVMIGEAVDVGEGGVAIPWPGICGEPVAEGPPCAIRASKDSRAR